MKTGKKVSYDRDAMIKDLREGMSNKDAAVKYNVSTKVTACARSRYINGKAKLVPPVEKCLRRLEKLRDCFGEEIFNSAIELL